MSVHRGKIHLTPLFVFVPISPYYEIYSCQRGKDIHCSLLKVQCGNTVACRSQTIMNWGDSSLRVAGLIQSEFPGHALSNPSSFCYGTTAVQDDAAPGTQEYIMLRQDSIHSADIRSKGSPFRAKCHEIFCCPLKQVVLKESAEPEGLFAPPPCFDLLMLLISPAPSRSVFPFRSYSV
ncbi:hypothetical protein Q8A73_010962 [Channa argus]|nr:hypothetical protein Q8A73_010962 [Channa argus]